jgi:hypothetical protein
MQTPTQTHQQTIYELNSTEGLVLLTPPTQKSTVLCTQPPAGEHHTKKADGARQPKKASKTTHTQAPSDIHTCPYPLQAFDFTHVIMRIHAHESNPGAEVLRSVNLCAAQCKKK